MCWTKSSYVGIVFALLLIFSGVGLACLSQPVETPPAPPQPETETETPSYTTISISVGSEIPENYATFTHASELFSISYPSDWEIITQTAELEQNAQQAIDRFQSGLPLEEVSVILLAGKPTADGYEPRLSITIEPMPTGTTTQAKMVAAEVAAVKKNMSDYQELSRVTTTIDGREATIIDFEGTSEGPSTREYLQMYMLVRNTAWVVSCSALPQDFFSWQDDFNTIVKSLQVYD